MIPPPGDEKRLWEVGKPIIEAAIRLGLKIDPEGFMYSWMSGTRLLVEKEDGEIVGMAMMTAGKRWVDAEHQASVLLVTEAGRDKLLEFASTIAKAMGAVGMYFEEREVLEETPTYTRFAIRHVKLDV